MPTGYTADVIDGKQTDVKEFLKHCARAFSEFYEQRDEAAGPARLPTVSVGYELNALAAAKGELDVLRSWSPERILREHQEYIVKIDQDNEHLAQKWAVKKNRLDLMLAAVEAWEPNEQAKPLRDFAVKQLQDTIEFDCGKGPFKIATEMDRDEWYSNRVADVTKEVNYFTEKVKSTVDRQTDRVAYARAVLDSIDSIGV